MTTDGLSERGEAKSSPSFSENEVTCEHGVLSNARDKELKGLVEVEEWCV